MEKWLLSSRTMTVLSGILPVFLLIGLGFMSRRLGWAGDEFVRDLNRVIYCFAIPALLLRLLGASHFDQSFSPALIAACLGSSSIVAGLALAYARIKGENPARSGTIIQASIRGNLVYMGFPLIFAAAGENGLRIAAVAAAILIPYQNLIAVGALIRAGDHKGLGALKAVILNPVILGVVGGLVWSLSGWQAWSWLDNFLRLLGNIAMPGALLALGAQMNTRDIGKSGEALGVSTALKLLVSPAIALILMRLLHLSGTPFLVGLFLLAAPTAVASTAVAQEMKGDLELAGACVMVTSLLSFPAYLLWGLLM